MTKSEMEKRLTVVEKQLSDLLKGNGAARSQPVEFLERIRGAFADDEDAFKEAMRLGRVWRDQQDHPPKRKTKRGSGTK
jgi:hypothetical protein